MDTQARCTIEKVGDAFTITRIELDVTAKVAGIDNAKFQEIANTTKDTCPVSRALKAVQISATAKLA